MHGMISTESNIVVMDHWVKKPLAMIRSWLILYIYQNSYS